MNDRQPMSRKKAPDGSRRGIALSADLGYLAGRLVATASATYGRLGVGSLEAKVLRAIGGGEACNGAQLSKVLGVDPAAISRTVKTLLKAGAIDRSIDVGSRLSLTAKGEGLRQQILVIAEERMRRLIGDLSPADEALLLSYLDRLLANMPELAELAAMQPPYVGLPA
jgi:DNA-binding MarR family transcriptional regulator